MGTDYSHYIHIYFMSIFMLFISVSLLLYCPVFSASFCQVVVSFLFSKFELIGFQNTPTARPVNKLRVAPLPLLLLIPAPSSVLIPSTSSSLSSIPSSLLLLSAPAPVPNVNAIAGVGVGVPNPMNRAGIAGHVGPGASCQLSTSARSTDT